MATYAGARDMIGPAARAFGVSKMSGDYAALADALGARGIPVRTAVELHEALAEAQRLNADGVTVLIDVQANVESRRSRF
jgi:thiamine pyrophosphate-dependent acetolactate synthase large subunit-like protein